MRTIDETEVSKLLRGVEIPPCPAVLAALAQEMHRPDASSTKVARLISQDVGLAAGVIKCANSPLFSTGSKVGSIGEALGRLGFNNVLNLVVNELLRKNLSQNNHAMDRFWDSATYCAGVCAKLAEILPGTSRDTAYTFGLFHDCGIPILMRRYPDYKKTLGEANRRIDLPFTAIEDEIHGTNHAVIGYLMARNWGLPETVSSAILSPPRFLRLQRRQRPLRRIVHPDRPGPAGRAHRRHLPAPQRRRRVGKGQGRRGRFLRPHRDGPQRHRGRPAVQAGFRPQGGLNPDVAAASPP